ncbi:TRAFAC clade GTPase domain-containing protein [Modestobacter sp. VKM Ac-2984]|uniref:TRAFAC clade GTPase domain-containing protein n=1 Tax=Modestobacter sp. VKM Ac-2984 TaxID=3004138 RepID=UPI0022AB1352|nr:hypothetical protein [Modestobacter sp. VKM Ac-2984]MCZ2817254.1 hypothetical protein [Modestobacter sp. VKM Ac-2984]
MAEFLMYLFLAALAIWAAAMIAWTIGALLTRLISFLVLYWMVSFTVAVVGGLLFGVVVPLRVLRGKGRAAFRQLTPADVAAGTAFRAKARGDARHYGWDQAWSTYFPYQAREDALGVRAECQELLSRAWAWVADVCSLRKGTAAGTRSSTMGDKVSAAANQTARSLPGIALAVLLVPPYVGFALGTWVSVLAWLLLMFVVGAVVVTGQQLALFAYRWSDVLLRRRDRAELLCTSCYTLSTLPSFRCSNPACTVVHRDLLPGPLGLRSRRCACGTTLPNTIRRAGAKLQPVCPVCNAEMPKGSGNRQTIPVPVIGSVGAGKTRLLAAATVQLEQRLGEVSGSVSGLTPDAATYLDVTRSLIRQHANTTKTAAVRPTGVPLLVTAQGKTVEVQLLDAAGENFSDWEQTAVLRYLDQARALVFVLDPLPFPTIARELRSRGLSQAVLTASGEQEEAYAAAVDRMRAENVRVKDRQLALVVTKADILLRLPAGERLGGHDSDSVRDWLVANEFDLIVQRCEKDFQKVTYFLVDSMNSTDLTARTSPVRVLEWVLRTCRSPLGSAIAPAPEPVATGTPEGTAA